MLHRILAVLALVALLAGCGGGSGGGTDAGLGRDDARRIAGRAQLVAADLGDGWTKTADEASGDDEDDRLQRCVGDDLDVAQDTLAESRTRTFERSPGGDAQQQVISSTAVLTSRRSWRRFFDIVGSDRFATCLSTVFTKELTRAAGDGVTIAPGPVDHRSAGGRVRITTPLTITVDRAPMPGNLDLLLVGRGQAVSVVVGFSVAQVLPADLLPHLGALLLDRQEAT